MVINKCEQNAVRTFASQNLMLGSNHGTAAGALDAVRVELRPIDFNERIINHLCYVNVSESKFRSIHTLLHVEQM